MENMPFHTSYINLCFFFLKGNDENNKIIMIIPSS